MLSIAWWLAKDPVDDFVTTQPGLDNRGAKAVVPDILIGEYFESMGAFESGLEETWPRFRGEDFNNISRSGVSLIEKFPEGGPLVKWKAALGEGYAGAAIFKGLVYVLDHDELQRYFPTTSLVQKVETKCCIYFCTFNFHQYWNVV